ncbi:MAG: hypothetical protein JXX29_14670 [Deltaproteobacteria bacterium]|nr:hypothetical protein [Deltaproteobacteria bacterium]MBN2672924.1 hypothetical protein [Deltaproteobacteria bacterium]
MRYLMLTILTAVTIVSISATALAKPHVEISALGTTNTILDDSFEFFAIDTMVHDTWGVDVRVEVLEIKDVLHLLPFVAYRYGASTGYPEWVTGTVQTDLATHDLDVGARMRGWFLPWLGAYAQLFTGISHIQMEADATSDYAYNTIGSRHLYRDDKTKWNLGATVGMELRISPRLLKQHGITRFNFGGEMGVGFMKRMTTNFNPSLEGGDDLSLDRADTVNFGDIDLSGVVFQFGLTVSFL